MRIYFDMNIYNRVFDDQTQIRIRFESMAVDILFELIEKGNYELMWSFILEYENSRNPFIERRWIQMLLNEKSKLTDREIIEKGSRALIKELGYSGFLRFIRHSEGISKEDYLKLDDEVFNGMSVDEIYKNAKKHWENK